MQEVHSQERDELRRQIDQLGKDLKELKDAAQRTAMRKLGDVSRATGEFVEGRKERARELEDELVNAIRDAPLKSLLIAAGLGLLLGACWSRR